MGECSYIYSTVEHDAPLYAQALHKTKHGRSFFTSENNYLGLFLLNCRHLRASRVLLTLTCRLSFGSINNGR